VQWQNRAHFFAVAAQCMRRILVDTTRARQALKRGGDQARVELDPELTIAAATWWRRTKRCSVAILLRRALT
jgi:hypothetical protein